jgi:uncharacterized repeat protein (TIGR02543 family)
MLVAILTMALSMPVGAEQVAASQVAIASPIASANVSVLSTAPTVASKVATEKVTLKFKTNGGKALAKAKASKKVAIGAKAGALPTAKRSGYTFKGWFSKSIGGTKIVAAAKIVKDTTVYAHWSATTKLKAKALKAYKKAIAKSKSAGFKFLRSQIEIEVLISSNCKIAYKDLNGDGLSELIYDPYLAGPDLWIYSYVNGKVKCLFTGFAMTLDTLYANGTFYTGSGRTGSFDNDYYSVGVSKVSLIARKSTRDYGKTYKYYLGKKQVSQAEHDKKIAIITNSKATSAQKLNYKLVTAKNIKAWK